MLPRDRLRSLSFPDGPPPTAAHLNSQIWTKTSGFSQRLLFLFNGTFTSSSCEGRLFFFLPSPRIDPHSVAQSCTEIWDQAGAGAELTAEVYPVLPWQAFPAGSSQAHVNYSNVTAPEEPGTPRIDPASQHLQPSASCSTWVGGRTLPTRGSQRPRKTAPAIWGQSGENVHRTSAGPSKSRK